MNFFDAYGEEVRRALGDFNRIQEYAQRILDQQRVFANPSADILRAQIENMKTLYRPPESLLQMQAALDSAMRPFPDVSSLSDGLHLAAREEMFQRINAAFKGANVLADIDLGEATAETSEDEEVARDAEEQLVKIAPPEALDDLRRVGFAPIVLLDKVMRNPRLMYQLGAREFEGFVATLIEQLGFENVILTPSSGDEGRDVLATKRVHGLAIVFAFECKRYSPDRPIGPDIARALLGTITHPSTRASMGVLVTTSRFTPSARKFIITEPHLDGRDFDGLVEWLQARSRDQRDVSS